MTISQRETEYMPLKLKAVIRVEVLNLGIISKLLDKTAILDKVAQGRHVERE